MCSSSHPVFFSGRYWITAKVDRTIQKIESRLDTKLDIGTRSFDGTGFTLSNIVLTGKLRGKVETVKLQLDSSQFPPLLRVSVQGCRILSQLDHSPSNSDQEKIPNGQSSRSFRYLSSVSGTDCALILHNSRLQNVYNFAFERVELDLKSHMGTFRLENLSYYNKSLLKMLKERYFYSKERKTSFLISSNPQENHHWQAKGHWHRKSKSFSLFVKNAGFPEEWQNMLGNKLKIKKDGNYALKMELEYGQSGVNYLIHGASTNLSVFHPTLSSETIGPIPFKFRMKGTLSSKEKRVRLDQGELRLLNNKSKSPIRFLFSLSHLPDESWRVQVRSPKKLLAKAFYILFLGERANSFIDSKLRFFLFQLRREVY